MKPVATRIVMYCHATVAVESKGRSKSNHYVLLFSFSSPFIGIKRAMHRLHYMYLLHM